MTYVERLGQLLVDSTGIPMWAALLSVMVGVAFAISQVFMGIAGLLTYVERKIAAYTQSRIGPNRVGPAGLGVILADGIKLILKEDIIPAAVDRPLFKMAPYVVVGGAMIVMAVLPLGPNLIAVDTDLGLLVYLAAGSFVTMGIVMSGWASNNKWSTMGAARSVAQIVSYEIPVGLALLPLILLTGSLSFQTFVLMQGAYPWQWNAFHNPGLFIATGCYFIAALAEINRTPFDIPEAESELVSGYNTEYSGMRFGMFFVAEFGNVWVISAITSVAFLGGWHFPGENWLVGTWFGGVRPLFAQVLDGTVGALPFAVYNLLGFATLMAKSAFFVVIIVLLRWTLPRVRVDQLMNVCWKYLVPMTLFATFLTGAWMVVPLPGYVTGNWAPGFDKTHGHWPTFLAAVALIAVAIASAWRKEHRMRWQPAKGTRHHQRLEGVEAIRG